jgi:transcriptional regulator with PAS, ATPase and Fis domain
MNRLPDSLEEAPPPEATGAMRQVLDLAARVAPLDLPVLITGESGVGKERLARWLHDASRRSKGPFVAVNCGAFADTLLDSELFGHVRGAFTGAVHECRGVFEAAQGGTLFLDEIGEISAAMQVKLLRVLQEREVRRVGETKTRPIDVRVIAATNRDLCQEVERQRFRSDLYYRLRVIDLYVPPLRERPDELRWLAGHLLVRTAERFERPVVGYTSRAMDRVLAYLWPGNIRELQHAIERACAIASGPHIDLEDLPEAVRGLRTSHGRREQSLADRERAYILAVLERNQGHRGRTADELGISLSTLQRRLRAYAGRG